MGTLCMVMAWVGYVRAPLGWLSRQPTIRLSETKLLWFASVITLISLIAFAALLQLLSIKAGQPLQLTWLTGYQTTFYGLGFMMLPLPPWPDAWYAVIAVYALALTMGLVQLRDGRALAQQLPLLYLPLLGAGLFTYFQGRKFHLPVRPLPLTDEMPSLLRAACEAHAAGCPLELQRLRSHPALQRRIAEFWSEAPSTQALQLSGLTGQPLLGGVPGLE